MAQADYGTIVASQTSGAALAAKLNAQRDADHSNHSGTARPSYVVPGMIWLDTSVVPNLLKLWTGQVDAVIQTIVPSTGLTALNDRYTKAETNALLTHGGSIRGSAGGVSVGTTETALAGADFTATGPAVFAIVNASIEGATAANVFGRFDLYRIDNGALVQSSATLAIGHAASGLERLVVGVDFTGLATGVAYRLRLFARASAGTVNMQSQINGICA